MSTIDFEQIVVTNNRFKLEQTLRDFETSHIDDYLTQLPRDDNDHTLLFFINTICMLNDETRLKYLLEKIHQKGLAFKFSPEFLYYLVRENNLRLIRMVVNYARDFIGQDFKSEKLGEYFNPRQNETSLLKAVKKQNLDLVRCLVCDCGAGCILSDLQKRSPVYIAAGLGSLEIVEFLEESGADLNGVCANGDTPLQRACMLVNVRNMEFLIGKGVDINYKGYAGNAPIHLARQRLDAFQLILKSGGDLTLKNDAGYSSFIRSCCVDNFDIMKFIHGEMIRRFEGSDYLRQEIIEAVVSAIINLKIRNVEYLMRFVESKEALNARLREILDLDSSSSHLNFYAKMNEVNDKKIVRFHELCMILIKYDLHPYPDQPLFYTHKFIELLNVNFLNKIFQFETLSAIKQTFIDCMRMQFEAMIAYGRMDIFKISYTGLVERFECLDGFGEILESIFRDLSGKVCRREVNCVLMCRNQVRICMDGLSDRQIDDLRLPGQLKGLMF